jgi:hypothetical protein
VVLAVIWWLIIFAIPAVVKVENLSLDIQAMADVCDAIMATSAYLITSAILAKRKRK